MKEKIKKLEKALANQGLPSSLNSHQLSYFPESIRWVHQHEVFGSNLLAVPGALIISGDEEEYECTFSFLGTQEGIEVFEAEYRPEIPKEFIPIGYFYGATEIVLLHKENNTVHHFHVADIVDMEGIQNKLENEIATLEGFLNALQIQTVSCFINPENYAQAVLIEIREKDKLYCDYQLQESTKNVVEAYQSKCQEYMNEGFKLHYGPKEIKELFA